ncbi:MAG: hypothetical protein UR78_C0016G0019 [Candidatus Moranbacteria bacterium GW2011_GWF2_35_39]|nr:MAG: hypothetical protein UR78_C0016G0019 [Candidatus Moranbacteria bacterium GW2011_GWF2_35_39]
MLNAIPIVGWLLDLIFKTSLALPFWLMWTKFGLGGKYFYFLPQIYHEPSFLNCLGLFIAVPILYRIFIPTLVSVSQTNKNNTGDKDK